VSVLDTRTGSVLSTTTVGMTPQAIAIDAHAERVYIANAGVQDGRGVVTVRGSVSVLDARSGALLRTLTAGLSPQAVGVDERSGRAFVVDRGGKLVRDDWNWLPSWMRGYPPFSQTPQVVTVPGSIEIIDTAH
jgi:DNA-binding beta-propeller fold protein YncE